MFMKGEFSNRLLQVSLFSALVYYITAYPIVFEKARKYFPIKFKKTHHLLIFHTFVFMVLMYVLTYFVFDPLVRVVEGSAGGPHTYDVELGHYVKSENCKDGSLSLVNGKVNCVSNSNGETIKIYTCDNEGVFEYGLDDDTAREEFLCRPKK